MAERSGIPINTIISRLGVRKMAPEQAMSEPVRKARRFDFRGEKLTIKEIAKRCKVPACTIDGRLRRHGMSIEEASDPRRRPSPASRFEFRGERLTVKEIAKRCGFCLSTIQRRLQLGMSAEEAATSQRRSSNTWRPPPTKSRLVGLKRSAAIALAAKEAGVSTAVIQLRLERGLTLEQARILPYRANKRLNPKSIIGKTYAHLTAVDVHYNHGWIIECKCDCGNKCSVRIGRWSKDTKSCGCAQNVKGPNEAARNKYKLADGRRLTIYQLSEISGVNAQTIANRIRYGWTPDEALAPVRQPSNMVGQRFGRLLVTSHIPNSKVEWICSCGKSGASSRYSLLRGDATSCGCSLALDRAGTTTLKGLKILRRAPENGTRDPKKGIHWICLCPKCGKEFNASYYRLTHSESCGCDQRSNHRYNVYGAYLTIGELAELSGMKPGTITNRIRKGLTVEQAVFTPEKALRSVSAKRSSKRRKRYRVGKEFLTSDEVAARAGILVSTFWNRLYQSKLTASQIIAMGPVKSKRVSFTRAGISDEGE